MRKKLLFYYKRLSLIQKLLIPMVFSLLFGVFLTVIIIKQVGVISHNTVFLQDELIPALEKVTRNKALLKKISENLTFAILAEDEDMISEIKDDYIIEYNIKEIIRKGTINSNILNNSLVSFKEYYSLASTFAFKSIRGEVLNDNMNEFLLRYKKVEKDFSILHIKIDKEISLKTDFIELISKQLTYFTVIYIIVFSVILFYISYLIYKDFNARFNRLNKSLDALGIQKTMIEGDDAMNVLSENIDRAIEDYTTINRQREELSFINRKVQNSIEYAALMQQAILPEKSVLDKYTEDNFVFWKPKDTVGGDIYFVVELESKHEVLIMVIDGVGHGVAGAFLTILVKAIQTQIVARINNGLLASSPAKILAYFNQTIKKMLKQETGSKSNTGFDGGVLYYNSLSKKCKYAGAKTPLYIIKDNTLKVIKSDRANVGFIRTNVNQQYTEHDVKIEEGTKLYIATDGIIDQEGVKKYSRYGKKRFEELILSNNQSLFKEQKRRIQESCTAFKFQNEQTDDITILGMQFI